MTEQSQPQLSEQEIINPVQQARSGFNDALFGDYKGSGLLSATLRLQGALLASDLAPEKVFHELSLITGQAAARATRENDIASATNFGTLQSNFELTHKLLAKPEFPTSGLIEPSKPTRTETLPPMTSAKGEMPVSTSKSGESKPLAKKQSDSTQASGEAPTATEETFASFMRNLRSEANVTQGKLGLTSAQISRFETGKSFPNDAQLAKIINALQLSGENLAKLTELYNKAKNK